MKLFGITIHPSKESSIKESLARPRRPLRFLLPALLLGAAAVALPSTASALPATCTNAGAGAATAWNKWECVFEVDGTALTGRNPYKTQLKVTFSKAPLSFKSYAFWDGPGTGTKQRFVVRGYFPAAGTWSWSTSCETPTYCGPSATDPSLATSGSVVVAAYNGAANPLYQFGDLNLMTSNWRENGVSRSWSTLYQIDGGEFVWIGDTAWAGPMRSTNSEWTSYINARKTSTTGAGVSLVQVALAPWWAGATDKPEPPPASQVGNPPFDLVAGVCNPLGGAKPNNCHTPNMAFWRRYESRIQQLNQAGIRVLVAGLMEPVQDADPNKRYPTTEEAVLFARWIASRLAGNHVLFSPGFDSELRGSAVSSLQDSVGTAIRQVVPRHLITNHYSFTTGISTMETMHTKPWLSFESVQSGHNNGDLALITNRARVMTWQAAGASNPPVGTFATTKKAAINIEAVYDEGSSPNDGAASGRPVFNSYRARQTAYLSWLTGSFGYTWGVGGLWDWGACSVPNNVCGYLMPNGWDTPGEALAQPSAQHLKSFGQILRTRSMTFYHLMDTYEQNRIQGAAGASATPQKRAVLARNPEWMLAYLPANPDIEICYKTTNSPYTTINTKTARLFNPLDGTDAPVGSTPADLTCGTTNQNCPGPYKDTCTWKNRFNSSGSPQTSDRALVLRVMPPYTWSLTNSNQLEVFDSRPEVEKSVGIYGQMTDSSGQPFGNSFAISSVSGLEASHPAAGRNGQGLFLVAWQVDANGDGLSEIWARWVPQPGGFSSSGPAFRVSPLDGLSYVAPAVGVTPYDGGVISWTSVAQENKVWARTVGVNQQPSAAAVQICGGGGISCFGSKVAANLDGDVSIGWVEHDFGTEEEKVMYQTFDNVDLDYLTAAQQANSLTDSLFWLTNLHVDAAGTVSVEYESRLGGHSGGTFVQAFDTYGSKVGGENLVGQPIPEE